MIIKQIGEPDDNFVLLENTVRSYVESHRNTPKDAVLIYVSEKYLENISSIQDEKILKNSITEYRALVDESDIIFMHDSTISKLSNLKHQVLNYVITDKVDYVDNRCLIEFDTIKQLKENNHIIGFDDYFTFNPNDVKTLKKPVQVSYVNIRNKKRPAIVLKKGNLKSKLITTILNEIYNER